MMPGTVAGSGTIGKSSIGGAVIGMGMLRGGSMTEFSTIVTGSVLGSKEGMTSGGVVRGLGMDSTGTVIGLGIASGGVVMGLGIASGEAVVGLGIASGAAVIGVGIDSSGRGTGSRIAGAAVTGLAIVIGSRMNSTAGVVTGLGMFYGCGVGVTVVGSVTSLLGGGLEGPEPPPRPPKKDLKPVWNALTTSLSPKSRR